uniref:Uncharacterized protein n=1 Tax=Arundo donax TaxID=35708 RepID=A0A0A8XYV0_ARUDO
MWHAQQHNDHKKGVRLIFRLSCIYDDHSKRSKGHTPTQ